MNSDIKFLCNERTEEWFITYRKNNIPYVAPATCTNVLEICPTDEEFEFFDYEYAYVDDEGMLCLDDRLTSDMVINLYYDSDERLQKELKKQRMQYLRRQKKRG